MRPEEQLLSDLDIEDLKNLLSCDWGRRLYYRIVFLVCGLEGKSYQSSGQLMAFMEGRRDVGIILKDEAIEHAPHSWTLMVTERVDYLARLNEQRRYEAAAAAMESNR